MNSEEEGNKTAFDGVTKYLRILMALVYIGAGIAVLAGPGNLSNISPKYVLPLGGLLIAYGLFRGYKAIKN